MAEVRIDDDATISQAELARYRELTEQERITAASRESLKRRLLSKIADNEPVETGPLWFSVQKVGSHRLTFEALGKIIGYEQAEAVRRLLPETFATTLRINSAV